MRDWPGLPAALRPHLTLVGVGPPVTPADREEDPLTDRAPVILAALDLDSAAGSLVGLSDGVAWGVTGLLPQFTLVVVSLSVYS